MDTAAVITAINSAVADAGEIGAAVVLGVAVLVVVGLGISLVKKL